MACSSLAPISWNFDLIRNLNDREVGELASLLVVLEGVSLSSTPNSRVWNLVSSGVFSCKSFFDKIIDNPSVLLFPFHKKLWKAGVPHKVKFFMWPLVQKGVTTNDVF
ncbi:hypothetical protein CsSME_00001690 [Camellia sinensis var. sinensis]